MVDHTTIRNNKLICRNCGEDEVLPFQMPVAEMVSLIDRFNQNHATCLPSWQEPQPDLSLAVEERAVWWSTHGETGLSSETIWNFFMKQNPTYEIHHPCDADDFSRCYKLLEAIPEWKDRIQEMKGLSKEWDILIENWDVITSLFRSNQSKETFKTITDFIHVLTR